MGPFRMIPLIYPFFILSITVFTSMFLIASGKLYPHNRVFLLLILAVIMTQLHAIFGQLHLQHHSILVLSGAYPLTFGPLLYLYLQFLSQEKRRFSKTDILHFLPFLALIFLEWMVMGSEKPETPPPFPFPAGEPTPGGLIPLKVFPKRVFLLPGLLYSSLILITVFFYGYLMTRKLRLHHKKVRERFSSITLWNDLQWIQPVIWVYIISFTMISLFDFIPKEVFPHELHRFSHLVFIFLFSAFTVGICYFGLHQEAVFPGKASLNPIIETDRSSESVVEEQDDGEEEEAGSAEKYRTSTLSDEKAAGIVRSIQNYMESERPYLDEEFTIDVMSENLQISRFHLSQTLNQNLGTNFYSFVNGYRIQDVLEFIRINKEEKINFLNLAFQKGFNSKSTFHKAFKDKTGMTPSEYKNRLLKEDVPLREAG